jgi:hypothetical protein
MIYIFFNLFSQHENSNVEREVEILIIEKIDNIYK